MTEPEIRRIEKPVTGKIDAGVSTHIKEPVMSEVSKSEDSRRRIVAAAVVARPCQPPENPAHVQWRETIARRLERQRSLAAALGLR